MKMKPQLLTNSSLLTFIARLIFLFSGNAMGAVIYVPDQYQTIQQGINAAAAGDTIVVRDGTYLLTEALDFKGKAITVRSENGENNCILDGQQKTRILYFHSSETKASALSGFTIQNGVAQSGGGIYFEQSSPTISQCIIRRNTASGASDIYGGGIYCKSSSPLITDCTISANNANGFTGARGGGIYCNASSPTIARCTISGNYANAPGKCDPGGAIPGHAYGGGVFIDGGSPIIRNSDISGNGSTAGGCYGPSSHGGGIYCNASSLSVSNSTISNNQSASSGGGIEISGSFATAINSIINGNLSSVGAGIYFANSSSYLTNCTVIRNIATNKNSGGVGCGNSSPVIINSILWENSPAQISKDSSSNPPVSYSDIDGGYDGKGNINANPLFVDIAGHDYHLKANSPCIDTGDNNARYLPEQDMDGKPRIWNGTVDMGAYEYQACATPAKANLISPSGVVGTVTPAYAWNAVPTASWYLLWVSDATTTKINQWYTAEQAGCSSGTGICSVNPSTALNPGTWRFWIQTYNACGYGPWSDVLQFVVAAGGVPGKATLVSPTGSITTASPKYIWNAVPSATWYQLWVNDSTRAPKIQSWFSAGDAGCSSGTNTCSVTPATALASGSGRWWIQTWNSSGYGPWSDPMEFAVTIGGGAPGKATLISPSGSIATTSPTYVWNAVSNATWYQLWVDDSSGSAKIKAWLTSAQVGCASGTGTCSIKASTALSPGACQWWIQTWNQYGYGPWSTGMQFTVTVNSSLIFSQPPTASPVHVWQISSFRHADDFILEKDAQVGAIRFWAVGNGGFSAAFGGDLSWAIYHDNAGVPGGTVASGRGVSINAIDTGTPNYFGNRYSITLNLPSPVMVSANTRYWVEIHEGLTLLTNDGTEILWVSGTGNVGLGCFAESQLGGSWWQRCVSNVIPNEQLAFELFSAQQ